MYARNVNFIEYEITIKTYFNYVKFQRPRLKSVAQKANGELFVDTLKNNASQYTHRMKIVP